MSINMHVIGFRAPDEQWKKMKDVYKACVAAGVEVPEEVYYFFDGKEPDDTGVIIDLGKDDSGICIQKYNEENKEGYTVDIGATLRDYPSITHIRFYNSY